MKANNSKYVYNAYPDIPYKLLSTQQRKLLAKILLTQSKSNDETAMVATVCQQLDSIPNVSYFIDVKNNIYAVKDDKTTVKPSYIPLMVSHLDTVHNIIKIKKQTTKITNGKSINYIPYKVYRMPSINNKGYTYYSPTGVGGDDKNGIFINLSLLKNKRIKHMKVLFTTEEETGRFGAEYSIKHNRPWFSDISYMLEPDRKGNNDIICKWGDNTTYSNEFNNIIQPIMQQFKYKPANGSVTDIFTLFEELNLSCFNFSCGYYDPHSKDESIVEHDLKRALDFATKLLLTIPLDKQYKQQYVKTTTYSYGYNSNAYNSNAYNRSYQDGTYHYTEVDGHYKYPITVRHSSSYDTLLLIGKTNISKEHLYNSTEKIIYKSEAVMKDLKYFIENNLITYDEALQWYSNLGNYLAQFYEESQKQPVKHLPNNWKKC